MEDDFARFSTALRFLWERRVHFLDKKPAGRRKERTTNKADAYQGLRTPGGSAMFTSPIQPTQP